MKDYIEYFENVLVVMNTLYNKRAQRIPYDSDAEVQVFAFWYFFLLYNDESKLYRAQPLKFGIFSHYRYEDWLSLLCKNCYGLCSIIKSKISSIKIFLKWSKHSKPSCGWCDVYVHCTQLFRNPWQPKHIFKDTSLHLEMRTISLWLENILVVTFVTLVPQT